jgi:hypothetical protein
MTTDFEPYYAISNLAVALTGFIGIIVALQYKDHRFSRLALSTIFGTSVGAMLFAYAPVLLQNALGPEMSWRVATGTFGIYHLFLIINHQVRQLQFRANTPVQMVIVLLSVCPVVSLKLAVGMGFLMSYAFDIFLLGLLWCIFIPAYLLAIILLDDTE